MFHRTAALTAATLALSAIGGTSVAFAGGNTETVTVTTPAPPPVTVTTPAPPPVTVTTPAPPPAPTPTKAKHHRRHHSSGSSAGSGGSHTTNTGVNVSAESSPETVTPVVKETANTTTTQVSTVPQGGIQAGGGWTALAGDGSSTGTVIGTAAGLLLVLIGTGLALRRRGLAS